MSEKQIEFTITLSDKDAGSLIQLIDIALKQSGAQFILPAANILKQVQDQVEKNKASDPDKEK